MPYQNKRNKTRSRIEQTFIALYSEKDISRITVREICDRAGINRSTFYTFFTDVYDLQTRIEERCLKRLRVMFTELFEDLRQTVDINLIVGELLRCSREMDGLPLLLIRRGDGSFARRIPDFAIELFSEKIGALNEDQKMMLRLGMSYHLSGIAALLNTQEANETDSSLEAMMQLLGNIANRGIVPVMWEIIGFSPGDKPGCA